MDQHLMHVRRAFKRRGNMSYDDSRAGNATSECAPVWNRVRGDMKIVFLIAVGAFLLSVSLAEGDVPMGAPQYHQRTIRPIILEPVKRYNPNSEDGPLNWFFKMVSRAMEAPRKSSPEMLGPLNLPGMAGQVYIRQVDSSFPWESNHFVIRMMTRDPVTGLTVPLDTSGAHRDRLEGSSRRAVRPHNYQPMKNSPVRSNGMIQQGFVPSPVPPAYPSWSGQYRQRPQQYSASYTTPPRPSSPNDFRYGSHGKEADQTFSKEYPEDYGPRRPFHNENQRFQPNSGMASPGPNGPASSVASPSTYQPIVQQIPRDHDYSNSDYNVQRFEDTVKNAHRHATNFYNDATDSSRSTQTPYPEYPPLRENELRSSVSPKAGNESHDVDNDSANNFRAPVRYRAVIRTDRMVPAAGKHPDNFVASTSRARMANAQDYRGSKSRGRMANTQDSRGSKDSRGFREGSAAKFDSEDVGGIEVIAAPNLKIGWDHESSGIGKNKVLGRSSSENSRDSDNGLNQDEDFIGMGNGKNLARGESAEHANDQPEIIDEPVISRRAHSRVSSYTTIDRAHRSQGSRNVSSEPLDRCDEESSEVDRMDEDKTSSIDKDERTDEDFGVIEKIERTTSTSNATAEVVQKVVNPTASSGRRLPERRKPRLVKAIYRRKPRIGIIKSSRESLESNDSSENKSSSESTLDD